MMKWKCKNYMDFSLKNWYGCITWGRWATNGRGAYQCCNSFLQISRWDQSGQGEDFGDEIEMTISKMVIRMVKVVIIKIDMMVMVSLQACTMYNVQYIMYNVQFTSLYSVHKMRYVTQDYGVNWCFCHLCNSRLLTIQNIPRLLEFEFATRMSHQPPFWPFPINALCHSTHKTCLLGNHQSTNEGGGHLVLSVSSYVCFLSFCHLVLSASCHVCFLYCIGCPIWWTFKRLCAGRLSTLLKAYFSPFLSDCISLSDFSCLIIPVA